MSETEMLQQMAVAMPLAKTALDLSGDGQGYGLIIVDEVTMWIRGWAKTSAPSVFPSWYSETLGSYLQLGAADTSPKNVQTSF